MYRNHSHARTHEMHFPFKRLAALALLGALAFAPLYGASAHVERPDGGGVWASVEDFNNGGLLAAFEVDGSGRPSIAFEPDEAGSAMTDIQTYDVAGIQGYVPIVDYIPGANDVESPDVGSGQSADEPYESGAAMSSVENGPEGLTSAEVTGPEGEALGSHVEGPQSAISADIERPDGALGSSEVERPDGSGLHADSGLTGQPGARPANLAGIAALAILLVTAAYLVNTRRART
jgi:hypothetical protein